MKKKSPPKKAATKAKPKVKSKAKAKTKTLAAPKKNLNTAAKKASPKSKASQAGPKKKAKGLSITELFQLKQAQLAAAPGKDWNHKKDLPPQDQHSKSEMTAHNPTGGKKSGFGGSRHH